MLGVILPKGGQGCYQVHPKLSDGKDGISRHEINWHMEEAMQDQSDINPPKDPVDRKDLIWVSVLI